MKTTEKNDVNITEIFGLTDKQTDILFSLEIALTRKDIALTENQTHKESKIDWLQKWQKNLNQSSKLESYASIVQAIKDEANASSGNLTWLYFIMLEATLFKPYFPLSESKDDNKIFRKLHYKKQEEYLVNIARVSGYVDPSYIKRFSDTYQKVFNQISGKNKKIIINILAVLAASGLLAALAGTFAGPIAVALIGSKFAGLHGAALVSACLAYLGGGAIAAGGAGMAGGVAVIVGGGALLGAAGGGAATTFVNSVAKSSPALILSQTVKLEVAMREILLNAQQDTRSAQAVISQLQERILVLERENLELKNKNDEDKKTLANLEKSIEYLRKAYDDMNRFKSSYEVGLNVNESGK